MMYVYMSDVNEIDCGMQFRCVDEYGQQCKLG